MQYLRIRRWFVLVVAVGLFEVGCGNRNKANRTAAPLVTPPAAPAIAGAGDHPSEDECRELGYKLEAAVASGDSKAVGRLLRIEDLMERSLSDLNLPASWRAGFLRGAKESGGGPLSSEIVDIVRKGGKYGILRYRIEADQPRLIMRLLLPGGGVNYHEMILVRDPNGQIAVQDIYVYTAGEMFSQTLRRFLLQLAAEQNQGIVAKLSGAEQLYTKHLSNIASMMDAAKQGRHEQALKIYRRMPAELRKDKGILLVAVKITQAVDDAEYIRTMELFRQEYPADPAFDMVSIDYYLLNKRFDKAIESLERLDKSVGGDPYLTAMLGSIMCDAGRYSQAKEQFDKAIADDPDLIDAYWGRVTASLADKDYGDTLDWLKRIVERFDVEIDEKTMRENDTYAAFTKSPQFDDFVSWYKAQKK